MRRLLLGLMGVVVVTAALLGGWALGRQNDTEPPAETVSTELADVIRTDLVQNETLSGTLGFGEPSVIRTALAGTVTDLPQEAQRLDRGDAAFEVDGLPVIFLIGDRPAWRPLGPDIDDGPDVEQLESNLAALGYGPDDWDADEEFDGDTADAVDAFREDLGLPEDDVIELGRVHFAPDAVRVGSAVLATGDNVTPGAPVFEYTGFEQTVVIELEPDRLDLVAVGDPVMVELPDDRRVPGSISEIARVVVPSSPEPDAPGIVEVVVTLDETITGLDQAPVDVDVESERAAGVLAVPVRALVALSDGGYAVEVGGQLIGVEIGDFAEGLVEVNGAISEGDQVVIPK